MRLNLTIKSVELETYTDEKHIKEMAMKMENIKFKIYSAEFFGSLKTTGPTNKSKLKKNQAILRISFQQCLNCVSKLLIIEWRYIRNLEVLFNVFWLLIAYKRGNNRWT